MNFWIPPDPSYRGTNLMSSFEISTWDSEFEFEVEFEGVGEISRFRFSPNDDNEFVRVLTDFIRLCRVSLMFLISSWSVLGIGLSGSSVISISSLFSKKLSVGWCSLGSPDMSCLFGIYQNI